MIAIESNGPGSAPREAESSVSATPLAASENRSIATSLHEIAVLLANQGASEFRVHAYQNASRTLNQLQQPVGEVLENEGVAGLIALPTIGRSIANLIEQYIRFGRIPLLARLRGEETAEHLFATLPSIGSELSHRIHEHLEIETLPELLAAINDGRLEKVPGIGRKRIRVLRECLAERLRHSRSGIQATLPTEPNQPVPVYELLDVDSQYRRLAAEGKLAKIAPHKFNPCAVAWLPILHTQRGKRHYTALYSNTARAHELNTTKDWVVIYRDDPESHGRWTVITSRFGKLRGWRIIRGFEQQCADHYRRDR